MKILYQHRTASKDGQAVHIVEMIDALRREGHEVRVVAPGASEANAYAVVQGGGRMGSDMDWVHRLKAMLPKAAYELMELAYNLVAYRKLMAVARDFQPHVIYERYKALGYSAVVGGELALGAGALAAQRRFGSAATCPLGRRNCMARG